MFAFELRQELIDLSEPTDEWADASCRDETGSLTELFFSDQIPDIIRALLNAAKNIKLYPLK